MMLTWKYIQHLCEITLVGPYCLSHGQIRTNATITYMHKAVIKEIYGMSASIQCLVCQPKEPQSSLFCVYRLEEMSQICEIPWAASVSVLLTGTEGGEALTDSFTQRNTASTVTSTTCQVSTSTIVCSDTACSREVSESGHWREGGVRHCICVVCIYLQAYWIP